MRCLDRVAWSTAKRLRQATKESLFPPRSCLPYAREYALGAEVRLTSGSHWDAARPSCASTSTLDASRLVYAMSAKSVKTRRAPSQHCRV